MAGTPIDSAISELNRRNQNTSVYQRRQADPDNRMFVYGLNTTVGVPTASDGTRMPEFEDPTFVGFNMEIESSESPLFQQIPCFLEKYGLHPDLRDRYELYNLFMLSLYNYIPFTNSDINGQSLSNAQPTPALSKGKQILNSLLNPITGGNNLTTNISTVNVSNNNPSVLFVPNPSDKDPGNPTDPYNVPNKLILLADQFYDPAQKANLMNKIGVKRHYITKLDGLASGRWTGEKEGKITVDIREDIALHSELMAYCYENFVYSQRSQRELIPENLQEFTLRIYVYEVRNLREFQTAVQAANSIVSGIVDPTSIGGRISNLIGTTNYATTTKTDNIQNREKAAVVNVLQILQRCFSMVRYTLHNCVFDFSEGGSIRESLNNETSADGMLDSKFDIKFRRVYKEYFSRLAPRWTSENLTLYWFDNYKSSPIVPIVSPNNVPSTLQSSSSPLANALTTQAGALAQNAVDSLAGDLKYSIMDDLNIKPIVPANLYRPGSYLDQFVGQLESTVGTEMSQQLLKGIIY